MSDYDYTNNLRIITHDLAGRPLPGGYYALVLPPIHGLITYVRFKPPTSREILNLIYSLGVSLAVPAAAGEAVPAAEVVVMSETIGGLTSAGEAAAEIGTVMEVTIEAEVLAASELELLGAP